VKAGALSLWQPIPFGEDEDGGYLWRGELRLWDNEILMGWYAANDGSVRSKGTMYFVMHPHGIVDRAKREHPYEVPSVVAVPIVDGGPDYLGWILEQTEQPA
jgi:hypothetical protein